MITPQSGTPRLTKTEILEIAKDIKTCPVSPWWLKDEVRLKDLQIAVVTFADAIQNEVLRRVSLDLERIARKHLGAESIKQPGWHHVGQAFVDGAREARLNPDATDDVFKLAADGYTKQIHERIDPEGERRLRENDWDFSCLKEGDTTNQKPPPPPKAPPSLKYREVESGVVNSKNMEVDPLHTQLRGRAKFLRSCGEIKSSMLMDKAAAFIEDCLLPHPMADSLSKGVCIIHNYDFRSQHATVTNTETGTTYVLRVIKPLS